jgi:chromosome segregation ATPase
MDQVTQINKLENQIDCLARDLQSVDKRTMATEVILPRLEATITELSGVAKTLSGDINSFHFTLKDIQNEVKNYDQRILEVENKTLKFEESYKSSEDKMKTDWRTAWPGVIKFTLGIIIGCGTVIYVAIQFMQTYVASAHP